MLRCYPFLNFLIHLVISPISSRNSSSGGYCIIAQALALTASQMCEGELDEVMVREQKRLESEAEYLNIIAKKTASLYEAAATLGAIIAGAREDEIKALSDCGRLFGMAFQIWDDLADQMQDTEADTASFIGTDGERKASSGDVRAVHP